MSTRGLEACFWRNKSNRGVPPLEVQDRYRGRELVFEAVDGCEIAVKGIFATWPRLLKEELHTPLSLGSW